MEGFNWTAILPIVISAFTLALTIYNIRKKATRNKLQDLKDTIDYVKKELKEAEDKIKALEQENEGLRKDKFSLLERLANKEE